MKPPTYAVVPHLDFFRITGLTGAAGLVKFQEQKVAEDVCRMLCAAYADGVRATEQAVRDALQSVGGRR